MLQQQLLLLLLLLLSTAAGVDGSRVSQRGPQGAPLMPPGPSGFRGSGGPPQGHSRKGGRFRCCCFLEHIKAAAKSAKLQQQMGELNLLLQQEGKEGRVLVAKPITEYFAPHPGHFSHGHVLTGDKASLPASFLEQLLAKGIDPPWHFLVEPAALDEVSSSQRASNSSSTGAAAPAAAAAAAPAAAAAVSVGALDFAAPEGIIFLAPWVMEALSLENGSAVFCRFVSLPVGGTVQLRPKDPNFLEAAKEAGGLQGALENELRHFSSITQGSIIPMKIGGNLFLFKVEKVLDEEGREVTLASIQDTDVALQLLPPENPPSGVGIDPQAPGPSQG